MKIKIHDIPPKGMILNKVLPPSAIDLDPKDIGLVSDVTINGKLERVNDFVMAEVDVSGEYEYTCARCLNDFHQRQTHHWKFHYELEPRQQVVDVGDDIRQELILARPLKATCPNGCDKEVEEVLSKLVK